MSTRPNRRTKLKRACAVALSLALVAPACTSQRGTKETAGAVIGAGAGAAAGSQIGGGRGKLVAVAVGTLAGALLGAEIGRSLDRADQLAMERTAQRALESNATGAASTWRNPDTGNAGSVTPVRTFEDASGTPCREYVQTIEIGGEEQQAHGTACRQPDGSWMITS